MQSPGPWVAGLTSLAVAWWSSHQGGGLRQGPRGLEARSPLNRVLGTEFSSQGNLEHPSVRGHVANLKIPSCSLLTIFVLQWV